MASTPGKSYKEQALEAAKTGDLEKAKASWALHLEQLDVHHDANTLADIAYETTRSSQPEILKWCFYKGFKMPQTSEYDTLYGNLCCSRSTAICEVLFEQGIDLNGHWHEFLGTIFSCAVMEGDIKTVRWLLENGHDVNAEGSPYEITPICEAIGGEERSMEMLKLMLAYKIDLQRQGALHFAAELGNIEAMKLLLDHGADIEERFTSYNSDTVPDRAVHTPLFRACNFGQVESVRFILEHGADPRDEE